MAVRTGAGAACCGKWRIANTLVTPGDFDVNRSLEWSELRPCQSFPSLVEPSSATSFPLIRHIRTVATTKIGKSSLEWNCSAQRCRASQGRAVRRAEPDAKSRQGLSDPHRSPTSSQAHHPWVSPHLAPQEAHATMQQKGSNFKDAKSGYWYRKMQYPVYTVFATRIS